MYPTDFSRHSLAALPFALDLACKYEAEMHCFHVVDVAYQYWMAGGDNAVPVVVSENEVWDSAQSQMDEFIKENLSDQNSVVVKLVSGRPFLEIIRYAQEENIDLIVIATHGRGALASMLMGSVTEKVVRKSTCPVLTVRHPEYKFEMP